MIVKAGYENESIAFALATGMVILDDQDGEKHGRSQRWARRKAVKGAR